MHAKKLSCAEMSSYIRMPSHMRVCLPNFCTADFSTIATACANALDRLRRGAVEKQVFPVHISLMTWIADRRGLTYTDVT